MNQKYYPYFRGRQFELLALRELLEKDLLSESIIPIVEPVKLSSTLLTTFKAFSEKKRIIGLVRNPEFGDVVKELKLAPEDLQKEYARVFQAINVLQVLLQRGDTKELVKPFLTKIQSHPEQWAALYREKDNVEVLALQAQNAPAYGLNLIPDSTRIRRALKDRGKVLLRDCFDKQERNADYQKNLDEIFTDDHTFAESEGYLGTGDYSIIGSSYSESGFAPYAVAIHIVYENPKGSGILRVRHFVSDSNDGIDDPAGKFEEAARKLASWVEKVKMEKTNGLSAILQAHQEGCYPGLGSLKKYSIMHHLELMGNILSR